MAKKVNLDVAQTLNITCRRGDTFQLNMTLKNSSGVGINLAGAAEDGSDAYVFAMQVRDSADSDGPAGLRASTTEGLPSGAVTDSYVPIEAITGDSSGNITIEITNLNMTSFIPGRYVYDLQYKIPSGGASGADLVKTVLKGAFVVNDDVTEAIPTS